MVLDSRVLATYLLKLVSLYSLTAGFTLAQSSHCHWVALLWSFGDSHLVRIEITSQSDTSTGRAVFDFYCLF
jgi:hypothetical protein